MSIILVGSGLFVAGLILAGRKLNNTFHAVLQLSEDLDPVRPSGLSESPEPAPLYRTGNYCAESITRLSDAVAGSRKPYHDAVPAAHK
jgi:hypothetical protein